LQATTPCPSRVRSCRGACSRARPSAGGEDEDGEDAGGAGAIDFAYEEDGWRATIDGDEVDDAFTDIYEAIREKLGGVEEELY
jgi:hypothetical protein